MRTEQEVRAMLNDRKRHLHNAYSEDDVLDSIYPSKDHAEAAIRREENRMDILGNQLSILEWVLGAEIEPPYLVMPGNQNRVVGFSPWPESSQCSGCF